MREYFLRLTLMLAGIAALWACSRTMESYNKANAAWNETLAIAGNGNATMATSASKTLSGEELMLELPFIRDSLPYIFGTISIFPTTAVRLIRSSWSRILSTICRCFPL